MNILYVIENKLYVNITNRCPCSCIFCIRNEKDGINEDEPLWLKEEPSVEKVKEELNKHNLLDYEEVVFCGYGEPLVRIDEVIEISEYIKSKSKIDIRVNTNGLSDLVHKKDTANMLENKIDAISISLNAPDKETYNKVSQPIYKENAFETLLDFAVKCKKYIKSVNFSIVDELEESEINKSIELAKSLEIPLKIRVKN